MIYFAVTDTKRRIVEDFLAQEGGPIAGRLTPVTWEDLARTAHVPRGTWILADLDALGPAGLELARTLRRTLSDAGLRTLNDPERTLFRFDLLDALHEAGLNRYRARRATDDVTSLRYPVFVRGASDHFGSVGDLLHSPGEVRELLDRAASAGLSVEDLIAVEFEDTAREDGTYAKYGAYTVGGRICPQHYMRAETWMIKHSVSVFTEEVVEEEYRYVRDNPHQAELREVFRLAAVEYGRVDYSVARDGQLQVWEINLCPIIGRQRTSRPSHVPADLQAARQRRKDIFQTAFLDALSAVDTDVPPEPGVDLDVARETRSRVLEELAPRTGGEGLLTLMRAKALFGQRW